MKVLAKLEDTSSLRRCKDRLIKEMNNVTKHFKKLSKIQVREGRREGVREKGKVISNADRKLSVCLLQL